MIVSNNSGLFRRFLLTALGDHIFRLAYIPFLKISKIIDFGGSYIPLSCCDSSAQKHLSSCIEGAEILPFHHNCKRKTRRKVLEVGNEEKTVFDAPQAEKNGFFSFSDGFSSSNGHIFRFWKFQK